MHDLGQSYRVESKVAAPHLCDECAEAETFDVAYPPVHSDCDAAPVPVLLRAPVGVVAVLVENTHRTHVQQRWNPTSHQRRYTPAMWSSVEALGLVPVVAALAQVRVR